MKVVVVQDECIGCGLCSSIIDSVFDFNDDGLMDATKDEITAEQEPLVREAIDSCPTSAIRETDSEVTQDE